MVHRNPHSSFPLLNIVILCMTCLKACPHRSVEVNLRPPGIELWTSHLATNYEVALLFLLLGSVGVHHLPQICNLLQLPTTALESWPIHTGLATLTLMLPGMVAFSFDFLATKLQPPYPDRPFRDRAYAYLLWHLILI
jgi:polyferredoxin